MSADERGRPTRDGGRFRVFTAAEIEPDDLIHWMGEVFYVADVEVVDDEVVITVGGRDRGGYTLEIPADEEVAVAE
jgi:hypothetical protein